MKGQLLSFSLAILLQAESALAEESTIFAEASLGRMIADAQTIPPHENYIVSEINYKTCTISSVQGSRLERQGNLHLNFSQANLNDLDLTSAKTIPGGYAETLFIPYTETAQLAYNAAIQGRENLEATLQKELEAQGKNEGLKGFKPRRFARETILSIHFEELSLGNYGPIPKRTHNAVKSFARGWSAYEARLEGENKLGIYLPTRLGFGVRLLDFLVEEKSLHDCEDAWISYR